MMNHSCFCVLRRGVVAVAVFGHLGLLAVPAAAQQTAAPPGPVLPLSMSQAEAMALESNLGLRADRLAPDIASENLAAARSAFIPAIQSNFSRTSSERASTSVFEGSSSSVTNTTLSARGTISQQLPWYGSNVSLTWNAGRNETSEAFARFNPSLNSGLSIAFTQPLLEGFKIDGARAGLQIAQRNRSIADVQLDQQIVTTRIQVQFAYLNLIGAVEQLKVTEQNLQLSKDSLRNNQARVEVGTMAPIQVIEAEAEVATNEEAVIVAESSVATAQDALRALIFDPARPDYWEVNITPTDTPQLQAVTVDLDAAIANALANRTDLIVARRQLENTDLNIELLHNQTKPSVDLQLNYSASGTGGTQNSYSNGFPPVLLSSVERGFSSVLGDAFKNNNPAWTVGVGVTYPLGKSSTEANLAGRRLEKQRTQIDIGEAELRVTTAVRDAARQVSTNFKRVEVTQVARERALRQLDAEQRRFDLGLSEMFTLQQRQRDLANARLRELRAIIDYSRSLIVFEGVQKAPVG
jgi:outer membrane protein TolC